MAVTGGADSPVKIQKFGDIRFRDSSVSSGTSTDRPSLTSSDIGFMYSDTTLNSPIWWNGTNWISPLKLAVCNNDLVICTGDEIVTII